MVTCQHTPALLMNAKREQMKTCEAVDDNKLDMTAYLQELIQVVAYVMLVQGWVQNLEVCVVDILKNQTRRFGLWIPYNIQKLDDVRASTDVLQDLDLTLDLQHIADISRRSLTDVQTGHQTFFFFTGLRILMMHF